MSGEVAKRTRRGDWSARTRVADAKFFPFNGTEDSWITRLEMPGAGDGVVEPRTLNPRVHLVAYTILDRSASDGVGNTAV